jgi:hypothetical protein
VIIRCIALAPSREQTLRLGRAFERGKTDFDLKLGESYVVLGIGSWNGTVWADIETGSGWPVSVPLMLFEVIDSRPSRFWEVRYDRNESLTLMPPPLSEPTFASQVADGDAQAVAIYEELCHKMLDEAKAFLRLRD